MSVMRAVSFWFAVALLAEAGHAADLSGRKTVALLANDGSRIAIGQVTFQRQGDGYRFRFEPDPSKFTERFLAMRPFLCLDGESQSLCHFPYATPRHVTEHDLTDLEYELMFLRKPRQAVSVDAFNGIYYEMRITERGIAGELREVDMTPIVVPDGSKRPIRREALEKSDPAGHWLPRLVIE
ncbi:MAG TPA: hypothetical protein VF104_08270 [Burkholderiales bacterium]